jgi:hypothetical protein
LGYLRTGEFNVEDLTSAEIKKVFLDLDYFQILLPIPKEPPTVARISWDPSHCSDRLQLTDGNSIVTKSVAHATWDAVLGSAPVSQFTTTTLAVGRTKRTMIGFAPKSTFSWDSQSWEKGWYFYVGRLYSKNGDNNREYTTLQRGIVTAIYDRTAHQISFIVNNTPCGIAFENVDPDEELYPALLLYDEDSLLIQ